jgi:hypothetical protein
MKRLFHTITLFILLLSCYVCSAQSNNLSLQYTGNEAYIKQKVADMLAKDCSSGDNRLKARDPHAFWLLNKMSAMKDMIKNEDDIWAWTIAMDECVKQYNSRMGRNAGSVELAMRAIEELIQPLAEEGIACDMLTASLILGNIEQYKTFNKYLELVNSIQGICENANQVQSLYYKEFKAWRSLNSVADLLSQNCSKAKYLLNNGPLPASMFSTLTCIIHGQTSTLYNERAKNLDTEQSIFSSYFYAGSSEYEGKYISDYEFLQLLNSCKTLSVELNKLAKEQAKEGYRDYTIDEVAPEISKYANAYQTELLRWCAIRSQIAASLPQDRQASYRGTTKQMYERFYKQLKGVLESELI